MSAAWALRADKSENFKLTPLWLQMITSSNGKLQIPDHKDIETGFN